MLPMTDEEIESYVNQIFYQTYKKKGSMILMTLMIVMITMTAMIISIMKYMIPGSFMIW